MGYDIILMLFFIIIACFYCMQAISRWHFYIFCQFNVYSKNSAFKCHHDIRHKNIDNWWYTDG